MTDIKTEKLCLKLFTMEDPPPSLYCNDSELQLIINQSTILVFFKYFPLLPCKLFNFSISNEQNDADFFHFEVYNHHHLSFQISSGNSIPDTTNGLSQAYEEKNSNEVSHSPFIPAYLPPL